MKKKSPNPTRKAASAANAKPRANAAKAGYYINITGPDFTVSDEKPKSSHARGPFTTLEEARSAALDELIAAIEAAEQQLAALKRAATFDQLRAAGSGESRS